MDLFFAQVNNVVTALARPNGVIDQIRCLTTLIVIHSGPTVAGQLQRWLQGRFMTVLVSMLSKLQLFLC